VAKVRDVVGLYLHPPERTVVLCVDEKSQIQALDRTQPILPLAPGVPERATHDYKRHGTSSLYAALDISTGKVIGALHSRHRAIEFKTFLQTLDREVPADLDVHVILDNSSTHKTPAIRKWLTAHPRFVLHFTPTSNSWLNLVERWFAELTNKKWSSPVSWTSDGWAIWPGSEDVCRCQRHRRTRRSSVPKRSGCSDRAAARSRSSRVSWGARRSRCATGPARLTSMLARPRA